MYTEKVVFNGSPIEFIAVTLEFLEDLLATGQNYSYAADPAKEKVIRGGTPYVVEVADLSADVPRAYIKVQLFRKDLPKDIRYQVTAIRKKDSNAQLTLRVQDDENLELVLASWSSLRTHLGNLGWLEVKDFEELPAPATWIELLEKRGFGRGTDEWWNEIKELIKRQHALRGKGSLPISSKKRDVLTVEKIVGYTRQHIARKINLTDEEENFVT